MHQYEPLLRPAALPLLGGGVDVLILRSRLKNTLGTNVGEVFDECRMVWASSASDERSRRRLRAMAASFIGCEATVHTLHGPDWAAPLLALLAGHPPDDTAWLLEAPADPSRESAFARQAMTICRAQVTRHPGIACVSPNPVALGLPDAVRHIQSEAGRISADAAAAFWFYGAAVAPTGWGAGDLADVFATLGTAHAPATIVHAAWSTGDGQILWPECAPHPQDVRGIGALVLAELGGLGDYTRLVERVREQFRSAETVVYFPARDLAVWKIADSAAVPLKAICLCEVNPEARSSWPASAHIP